MAQDGMRRHAMAYDGMRWHAIAYDGMQRHEMARGGARCHAAACGIPVIELTHARAARRQLLATRTQPSLELLAKNVSVSSLSSNEDAAATS